MEFLLDNPRIIFMSLILIGGLIALVIALKELIKLTRIYKDAE